jgi:hypothetical protein
VSKWQDVPKEEIEIDGEDINICLEGDNFGNNYCVVKKADMLELLSPGWISVKDRLPEGKGAYLIYHNNSAANIAIYSGSDYWSYGYYSNRIYPTHWMPLPAAPEDK